MISTQAILSGLALAGIVILAVLVVFVRVPPENHDFIVAAISSLGTALTVGGGSRLANMLSQNGQGATDQADGK